MKRNILVAAALAVVLVAARLPAEEPVTLKTTKPDWHYRWHEGRWWYSMPDSKWVYWNGSTWVPFEQSSRVRTVSEAKSASTDNGNAETTTAAKTAEPAYSSGPACPTDSSYSVESVYSVGSCGSYAGYGWSWGPGTPFRDGPSRRF
jgi:hypothetical protein